MAEQHWSCGCIAVDGKVVQECRIVPKGTQLAAHEVAGLRAAEAHECFRERQESQAAALTEQKTVELPTPDGNTDGPQGSATVTAVDTDTNTVTLEAVDGVQS